MKMTLRLTLDGLLRALRARAHREADEIESGRMAPSGEARREARMTDDDRGDD